MKITCLLGRIAPVEDADVESTLQGVQNSKKWIIDIEHRGTRPVAVPIKLLEYRTGKAQPPVGHLSPSYAAITREGAQALVYFPSVEGDKLVVSIEPKTLSHKDVADSGDRVVVEPGTAATHIRVTVDAIHTLMR